MNITRQRKTQSDIQYIMLEQTICLIYAFGVTSRKMPDVPCYQFREGNHNDFNNCGSDSTWNVDRVP